MPESHCACRPLVHALANPGVKSALGIEVDEIKCMKSESVIHDACQKLRNLNVAVHCVPLVLHRNIETVSRTIACCHIEQMQLFASCTACAMHPPYCAAKCMPLNT